MPKGISSSDPRTKDAELQVQKIINLQHLANNLPDSFMNHKGVTKSYNPAINAPERVEIPKETTQLPIKIRGGEVRTQNRIQLHTSNKGNRGINPLKL